MIRIQLEDEIVAALTDRARSRGLSLEAYLAELAERDPDSFSLLPRVSGDDAVRLIEAEAGTGGTPYPGTYPREDIYFNHDR